MIDKKVLELSRHFWAIYPPKNEKNERKLLQIKQYIVARDREVITHI